MKNYAIRTIVAVGIGAALFFVCGRFIAIPCPIPNVTINIQYGVLAFMAAAFGPIAGLLIGLIGHTLIDFSWGWGVWWSWVLASAIFGFVMGCTKKLYKLNEGEFGTTQIVRFNRSTGSGHHHLCRARFQGFRSGNRCRSRKHRYNSYRRNHSLHCLCSCKT